LKLISDEYKELNRQLHETRKDYGAGGYIHANRIKSLIDKYSIEDVLDYGSGKGTLSRKIKVTNYDPCILGLNNDPVRHDLVVCTDVLEHIEPEYVDNVISHIKSLAKRFIYLNIATRKACKTLPDGRNTHLLVKEPSWWLDKFQELKKIDYIEIKDREITIIYGKPAS